MSQIYCGIDNGIEGGLVWINDNSEIVGKLVMPTRSTGKKGIHP